VNALAKFEISSSTPLTPQSDLMGIYGGFAPLHVPAPQPLDLKSKQFGTVSFIGTHSDNERMVVVDTSAILAAQVYVRTFANDAVCTLQTYPIVNPELFVAGTVEFAASNSQFCAAYAVLIPKGASTASSLLTTYLDHTSGNPTLDALASYESLNEPNWDGYDAEPITRETLNYARRFIHIMPETFGTPDMAPSGDGSITLEWVPETGPIHKLFLDIGPGEQWRAYWKRRNGEFGRQPGTTITPGTKRVLQKLFDDLSK
jgi:hypothetical protein